MILIANLEWRDLTYVIVCSEDTEYDFVRKILFSDFFEFRSFTGPLWIVYLLELLTANWDDGLDVIRILQVTVGLDERMADR